MCHPCSQHKSSNNCIKLFLGMCHVSEVKIITNIVVTANEGVGKGRDITTVN